MIDLGFVLILYAIAAGLGLGLLDRLRVRPESHADALALAVPLGLGVLAFAVLGLGETGLLNRPALTVVLSAGTVSGFALGSRCLRRLDTNHQARPEEGGKCPPYRGQMAVALAAAATLLATFLATRVPVTDGDALCYHLQVPKVFLASGSVGYDPDLHETVYPLLTELLYAIVLAFRGPEACRLVAWGLGLCFAALVTTLARPNLGTKAWWAGTIALLVPSISAGMTAPLNDVPLAAFGALALWGCMRLREQPSGRNALLAGIFAGLALGVKYPAIIWVGLLVASFATWTFVRLRTRAALRLTLILGATILLTGGVWYLRAWHYTGNPVFPFFRSIFGTGLDAVLDPTRRRMPVTLVNLLTALGPLTLDPARFDSFAHQLGPLFLLILPALLVERPPRRVVGLVALAYLFIMLCLSRRQSTRFILIAVGPMSVGVAWLLRRLWPQRSVPARLIVIIAILSMGFEASLAVGRTRHGLKVALGIESRDAYLTRLEPTYEVGRWIDANLPARARIVGQDHRGFYIPRPYTMELAHRRRTGLGRGGERAEEVVAHFRRQGFTHILFCPPIPEDAIEFDPTLGRLLAPWLSARTPIYHADLSDGDGVTRRYSLYRLDLDPAALAGELAPGRTRP